MGWLEDISGWGVGAVQTVQNIIAPKPVVTPPATPTYQQSSGPTYTPVTKF